MHPESAFYLLRDSNIFLTLFEENNFSLLNLFSKNATKHNNQRPTCSLFCNIIDMIILSFKWFMCYCLFWNTGNKIKNVVIPLGNEYENHHSTKTPYIIRILNESSSVNLFQTSTCFTFEFIYTPCSQFLHNGIILLQKRYLFQKDELIHWLIKFKYVDLLQTLEFEIYIRNSSNVILV